MRRHFFLAVALLLVTGAARPAMRPVEPDPVAVNAAIEAFQKLSKKEKRAKFRLVKKELKAYKEARKAGKATDTNTVLLVILAILLPPLAVYLHQGATSKFWITLLLFLLGLVGAFYLSHWLILAAIVYALLVVLGAA
ncbi:MAG TPA: YqaE/Pmp3 family membrane protein [Chitinophagaceae bacterium]|nr:YqaE/Pmp3 family membrane protein [Chitinophagaceae bacterium]